MKINTLITDLLLCFLAVASLFASEHNSVYFWISVSMLLICGVGLGAHIYKMYVLTLLMQLIKEPDLLSLTDATEIKKHAGFINKVVKVSFSVVYKTLGGKNEI